MAVVVVILETDSMMPLMLKCHKRKPIYVLSATPTMDRKPLFVVSRKLLLSFRKNAKNIYGTKADMARKADTSRALTYCAGLDVL